MIIKSKKEDVQKIYEIKCNKVKPEELTDKMKSILWDEAMVEVATMDYVNSGGK